VPARDVAQIATEHLGKLRFWAVSVEADGLEIIRGLSGYHDEPLKGSGVGQRSMRLSSAHGAIYIMHADQEEFVDVIEVHKHRY